MTDPSLPPLSSRRRRETVQQLDLEALVCARCDLPPERVVHQGDDGRLRHDSVTRRQGGVATICGGVVVPRSLKWQALLESGRVAVSFMITGSLTPHLVRLGRPINARSGSWSGTALCGAVDLRHPYWVPVMPQVAKDVQVCIACQRAPVRADDLAFAAAEPPVEATRGTA